MMPLPETRQTAAPWLAAIKAARAEPDPVLANLAITRLHFLLSHALAAVIAPDSGPNFHTWAVWGSRKAGDTIRQEDLDEAVGNATRVAGAVGALVGVAAGLVVRHWLGAGPAWLAGVAGAITGAVCGAATGRAIAIWSRREAAAVVLEGNRTVLEDIGTQTALFMAAVGSASAEGVTLEAFFAGLRPGPTEKGGQDRLGRAFSLYDAARTATDPLARRRAMVEANQEIVYHEHIRLDPYISRAMPFIVRRCATQRLMTYEVGDHVLTVGEDVPGGAGTAARNWADIRDRMRYVYALFDRFHEDPEVATAPFPPEEMATIASGRRPPRFAAAP